MTNLVQFFKCLSDDTRLNATLLIHQEGELCVCELTVALEDSQPKISRHLAQLRTCGLLTDERRGQWVYYRVSAGLPQWALAVLDEACGAHQVALAGFKLKLERMTDRPSCC